MGATGLKCYEGEGGATLILLLILNLKVTLNPHIVEFIIMFSVGP